MEELIHLLLVLAIAISARAAVSLDLDYKSNSLTYGGYTFQKVFDSKEDEWTLEARRGTELIHTFGTSTKPEWIRMGLVQLVPASSQQIMLSVYSGGAHCCSSYWIVSAEPAFRLILNTSEMNAFGDPRDIDGNGNLALPIGTTTFDYFRGAFAWSPRAYVWFKYDAKAERFVPANDLCFAETQKEIDSGIATLRSNTWKQDAEPVSELRRLVLDVVIADLYAGHDREAWEFFDREYKESDRDEVKADVIATANHDPYYQELLQRFQNQRTR
jgi:hypothetical protein